MAEVITATTDLTAATKSVRKAIMRELTGLHHLQAGALRAGERRKDLEEQLDQADSQIERLSLELQELPGVRLRLAELEHKAGELSKQIRALDMAIGSRRGEYQRVQEAARRTDEAKAKREALDEQDLQLSAERRRLVTEVESLRSAAAGKADAEAVIARGLELERQRQELSHAQVRINAETRSIVAAHQKALAAHQNQAQALQRASADAHRRVERVEAQHAKQVARVTELEAALNRPDWTVCAGCGQDLPPARLDQVQAELAQKRAELDRLRDVVRDLDGSHSEMVDQCADVDGRLGDLKPPAHPSLPEFDQATLAEVNGEIRRLDLPTTRRTMELATQAEATSAAADRRRREIDSAREGLRHRRSLLAREIDGRVYARRDELLAQLRELETELADRRTEEARNTAHRETAEELLKRLETREAKLAVIQATVVQHEKDARDWRLLEQALGVDGVQALELEALAPGIADVANRLLAESHGGRFRLRFDLQRPSGAGAKRKLVEDFRIVVYDAAHADYGYHQDLGPGEQLLETLSGGEAVWCREALYTAFSVVRARNSGLRFLTCFLDEADDGLDPDAKDSYFRLLEAAHHEAERHQTIVITHAPAIQQTIGQVIELAPVAAASEVA